MKNSTLPWREESERSAFTLTEIVVVIAIIGLLAALSAWGAFAVINRQNRANTSAAILTINKFLQARWAAVVADAQKEMPSPCALAMANNDLQRAKVIWVKARLAEAFPVVYAEVDPLNPNSIANMNIKGMPMIPPARQKPYFKKYQLILGQGQYTHAGLGQTPFPPFPTAKPGYSKHFLFFPPPPPGPGLFVPYPLPPQPDPSETSACLLMALNTLHADAVSVNDQLKPFIADTNGDGQPELIDSWGNPLTFFRFPWNNADLQAANPAKGSRLGLTYADPLDPSGALINQNWYGMTHTYFPTVWAYRFMFECTFHSVTAPKQFVPPGEFPAPGTLQSPYIIPAIVSSGPDGLSGLNPTIWKGYTFPQSSDYVPGINYRITQDMSVVSPNDASDNIVSFLLATP